MRISFWAIPICAIASLVPSAFGVCTIGISPNPVTVAASGNMSFTATPSAGCTGTYSWSSSIGTFSPNNTATTTFTAQATPVAGTITVTLTKGTNHVSGSANVTINAPLQSGFFGLDINQTNAVGQPAGENDPWPSLGGGVNFGTYRSLGSSINWSNLVQSSGCPAQEGGPPTYTWTTFDKWLNQAYLGGQKVMYDAYSTPTCAAFGVTTYGSQPCAGSLGTDGCYLAADVSSNDATWKGFINDLLAHLLNTTFPNTTVKEITQLGYIEVWNEPNIGTECDGTDHNYKAGVTGLGNCTAPNLATMLSDAYTIVQNFNSAHATHIKVVSPAFTATSEANTTNCVLTPATIDSFFSTFLGDVSSSATHTASMDYIGFHGYNYLPQNTSGTPDPAAGASCIGQLASNVQSTATSVNTGFTQPLYDTEGSWGSYTPYIYGSTDNGGAGREQAFTGIYNIAQAAYGSSLQGMNWYGWDFGSQSAQTLGAPSVGQYWDFAGSGSLIPAGNAYVGVYNWISGSDLTTAFAAPVAACAPYQSTTVWTCQFVFPNGKFGLAVWDNNGTCSLGSCTTTNPAWPVPATPGGGSAVYTHYYNLITGRQTISVGTVPISLQPILINN